MLLYWFFGVGVGIELILQFVPFAWRARIALAVGALLANSFAAGALALLHPNVFTGLIAALGLLRAMNAIRIVEARMHDRYLHMATRRTFLVCVAYQIGIALCWVVWERWHTTGELTWTVIALCQLVVAVVLLATTIRRLQHTAWPGTPAHSSDAELPTVTVAIPARNETEDLQACLQSLIASDYPKLEIVVLDDCSQLRRTPEIIRGFAHDGVRFVQGEEPKETWLPKNQAYDRLLHEASGEYVLFCGVDIRFTPDALRQILSTMRSRKKQMMSFLPERAPEARNSTALAQAMRYAWELVPPRRLFHRPPVLSSCWIIQKEALERAGGFTAVTRSIVPEAHFARELAKTDEYSFMRAGRNPGLSSVKGAAEQRATALRMRYPQVHRRPENVFALSVWETLFLIGPFVLALTAWWTGGGVIAGSLGVLTAVLLTITFWLVAASTSIITPVLRPVAVPLVVVYDIGMLYYSMWQYEFSEVDWKGRNICVPAMHVIPHLPKLD